MTSEYRRKGLSRRTFLGTSAGAFAAAQSAPTQPKERDQTIVPTKQPNVLFIMTDQQRFDSIAALGNPHIYTPNYDRLVRRGVSFTNAYSTCPVCVPARYTLRTGCTEPTIGLYNNGVPHAVAGQAETVEGRCGPYIARTMGGLGYRSFGVGKFHSQPWDEDLGWDVQLHSEELYGPGQRDRDAYAAWIAREHPEYDFIEGLMGERSEMYYMPQMSPTPAECGVERWATDRIVELIKSDDGRPFFGFASFVGPHPPFAPPIPFNRMYDPDRMPDPIVGDIAVDHMDEQIPWMNDIIWAENINAPWARVLKARYYGEISYIDDCLGRILDVVEARDDADNTVICFFADHGDHLGDHHAWQKESFFEQACHIPYLVSWPAQLPKDTRREDLVCLEDLFGIATAAAGSPDLREGINVLGMITGVAAPREHLIGFHGEPGTKGLTIMARRGDWKYIYIANGGREQLFNIAEDPQELDQRMESDADVADDMRQLAVDACRRPSADRALDGDGLRSFDYEAWKRFRIYQFDNSRCVTGFPEDPGDAIKNFRS